MAKNECMPTKFSYERTGNQPTKNRNIEKYHLFVVGIKKEIRPRNL